MYGSFELDRHFLGVGDEVGREIAAIELHAFDDIELELEALGLFDGDHAFLADLVHRLGDFFAHNSVAIGGDAADLSDLIACPRRAWNGDLMILDDLDDGEIDAALQVHRVHARCRPTSCPRERSPGRER